MSLIVLPVAMTWIALAKYLGQKTVAFSDIAGKGKNQKTFNEIPEEADFYAAWECRYLSATA